MVFTPATPPPPALARIMTTKYQFTPCQPKATDNLTFPMWLHSQGDCKQKL